MEFRSWPAGSMPPGTDPAALRVITTAVLVGLVASGVALASGLGLTGAVFLAGGDRPPAGPKVVPAVDVFMVQHAITTGQVPAQPPVVPSPSAQKVP